MLQAAQAYDAAARSIRGDTAVCNFPLAEGQSAPAPQRYAGTCKLPLERVYMLCCSMQLCVVHSLTTCLPLP